MNGTKSVVAVVLAVFVAAIASAGTTGGALAADVLGEPTSSEEVTLIEDAALLDAPEIETNAFSGWYLRGDISYNFIDMDSPRVDSAWLDGQRISMVGIEDQYGLGIGIGYQFSQDFRADITGEYSPGAEIKSASVGGCGGIGLKSPKGCIGLGDLEFSTYQLRANAYADLGNFMGFTPYLGAGVGAAYVQWSDVKGVSNCQLSRCKDGRGKEQNAISFDASGEGSWRLAWAVHAGVSYDINDQTKLDLAYTYNRIEGDGIFGAGNSISAHDQGFDNHVVRIGLRYQIW